jgi:hypothetical protein
MGHVAPPLAVLTAHAQTLTSAGDLVGARAILTDALDPVDADPQRASPDLATAAALLARILIALGDPQAARLWAGFAHAAEDRLHGPHDERTVAAAALHAAVLHRIGNYGRAAQVYHDLVGELAALDGPDSPRALAAEADLATAEHAAGHCTAARARLRDAWNRHREVHGDAAPAGIKMLARLGSMERECGRAADAQEHLTLAQELSARYLPSDHPLAVQSAMLAQAGPSGRHVCGRVARSAGPETAPGVMPVHRPAAPVHRDAAPGGPLAGRESAPGVTPVHRPAAPGVREVAAPAPAVREPWMVPPAGSTPQPETVPREPVRAETAAPPEAGRPGEFEEPDNRETDPKGKVYQQPLYLSDLHQAPGDLTGRHARADTPPPLPGQRAPEVGPHGRQIRIGAVQPPPSMRVTPADRRLPVPTPTPKTEERRSWQPLVLVAALVAGIAVAAAVVVAMLPHGAGEPAVVASAGASAAPGPKPSGSAPAAGTPSAAAPTTAPAKPAGGAPPGNLKLQDNRDSVSLTWVYPRGSEGPVLISGGRTGQEQRAFQQLPAGTSNYVVYGLNAQSNYCFTVAVVYTVNDVATTPQVCTNRR